MSPHPPIKPLKQALKDRFPTDSVFLTGQLREVVDEFSPHNVDSFRGDQTKYFNARVQKYCRRIWKGDWPSTVKESNEYVPSMWYSGADITFSDNFVGFAESYCNLLRHVAIIASLVQKAIG